MRASLDGRNPRQMRQGLDKPRAIVLYKPTGSVSRDCCALLLAERPGALAIKPIRNVIKSRASLTRNFYSLGAGYACVCD